MAYGSSRRCWTPPTLPTSFTLTASTTTQQSAPNGDRLALSISSEAAAQTTAMAATSQRWRVVAPRLARTDGSQIVEILRRCTPLNARAVSQFRSCCPDVLWLIAWQQHSNRRDGACRPLPLTRTPRVLVCVSYPCRGHIGLPSLDSLDRTLTTARSRGLCWLVRFAGDDIASRQSRYQG